ncbi:MAG: PAS domain-containing protein [Clostridia bacterium]|nr:PAS domain-containing protein [Clostridia bacterium]
MYEIFKSVLEQDRSPIVICDLNHNIIYMNPTAIKQYGKYGGERLVGQSLLNCHNARSREMIEKVIAWFAESRENNMIFTSRNDKVNRDVYMVALRDGTGKLIGYYEKHEYRNAETAELYDFSKSLV